jgi:hypothetical protein
MDDDGVGRTCPYDSLTDHKPAATSFIMNNGSNESLPSHALDDLPVLPERPDRHDRYSKSASANLPVHPARQNSTRSPVPSYTPPTIFPSAGLSRSNSGAGASSLFGQPGFGGIKPAGKNIQGGRRSHRYTAPVEGMDSDSEAEGEGGKDTFGIGSDDEEDISRSSHT